MADEHAIRALAEAIYQARRSTDIPGDAVSDWRQAEAELVADGQLSSAMVGDDSTPWAYSRPDPDEPQP